MDGLWCMQLAVDVGAQDCGGCSCAVPRQLAAQQVLLGEQQLIWLNEMFSPYTSEIVRGIIYVLIW